MNLAHRILAGAALAVSMATSASAADLLVTPDPIYNSPLFDFEGLYIGGTGGASLSGGSLFGNLGGVVGANFAITDGIIVGGDYAKEADAIDNVAVTSDGGATWTLAPQPGLTGFRSVVAYRPGTAATFIAVGPLGADITTNDGRTWSRIDGPGFDTFSFARGGSIGWGAGSQGRIAQLR